MLFRKLSLVLALALFFAACGGGDDDATATTAPTAGEVMEDDEMAEDEMSDDAMTDDEMTDNAMSDGHMPTTFTVTITTNADTELPTPLAPGAYLVHTSMDTLFVEGQVDRGDGLEALAEDGDPGGLVTSLESVGTVSTTGVFATPDGAAEAGPALPGSSYSFTFEATPGDYLSFATMFVQSNDWFFAPASSGVRLFDGDTPIAGDITSLVGLWDAGTEVDETPGEGPNQAPRQAGPNTGDTQGDPVTAVSGYDGAITVTVSAA